MKILVAFSLILLSFLVVILANYKFSEEVNENSQWLNISEQIIKSSHRLQRNIADMESGFRGYLLVGDNTLLEPYNLAKADIPSIYLELDTLMESGDERRKDLDSIQINHKQWEEFATSFIAAKMSTVDSDSANRQFYLMFRRELKTKTGTNISNNIRKHFRNFNSYEYQIRNERRTALVASVQSTRKISMALIFLSLFISFLSVFYLTRTISKRVKDMVESADKISKGNFNISIVDNASDELSQLSASLNVMAKKLNRFFSELEKKNNELDQFAYIVSHDLKAPLKGIESLASWIREDIRNNETEKIDEYLNILKGRVKRMENLIDGILQLAKVDKSEITSEKVNLNSLVQECVDLLSPGPNVKVEFKNLPVISGSKVYLQQVFSNLIGNAIKHNDKADCKITIKVKETEKYYEIAVQDNGPGISALFHDRIFLVFQTLKERDAFESTGVGLAIVKKIIARVNGHIKVESEINNGATFTISWPKTIQLI